MTRVIWSTFLPAVTAMLGSYIAGLPLGEAALGVVFLFAYGMGVLAIYTSP